MRIALIDNMNNNFFALARYLRDLGHEAELFLIPDGAIPHFHPRNDTWEDVDSLHWIKTFPGRYHWSSYWRNDRGSIRHALSGYEKIIACGASVGLLYGSRRQVDLFVPYGSDLICLPFDTARMFRGSVARRLIARMLYSRIPRWQALGIQTSRSVVCNTNWRIASDALARLSVQAVNLPRVMVYLAQPLRSELLTIGPPPVEELRVFSPTRHLWATNVEPLEDFPSFGGAKRNDVLIRAFAEIVRRRVYRRARLILCNYGADVSASKSLIESLGIAAAVEWLPLMPRTEIYAEMRRATMIADQFRVGMSGTSAGTANEALACGVPIVTNSDGACQDPADPYYGSPILDAVTVDQVVAHLLLPAVEPDRYVSLRRKCIEWFDANLAHTLAQRYVGLLN